MGARYGFKSTNPLPKRFGQKIRVIACGRSIYFFTAGSEWAILAEAASKLNSLKKGFSLL